MAVELKPSGAPAHAGAVAPAPGDEPSRSVLRHPVALEVACAVVAMGLALLVALVTMRVWTGDLAYPIGYQGDALLAMLGIQGIAEDGWYLNIDRVGAPFGLELHDYAVGADNGNFLIFKVLSLFTSWTPYLLNGFFILSFPIVALSAYGVMRALGIGRAASVLGAVLFAIIPLHFNRGTAHMFLGNAWAVPLGAYLFVQVLRDEPLFARRGSGTRWWDPRAWASRRTAITLALCALIASGGIYFAAFTVALVLLAALAGLVVTRRLRAPLTALAIVGTIGAVLAINLAPSILYQRENGDNPAVAQRQPIESEVYSLRPAQLLLPQPNHRIDALGGLWERWSGPSGHNGEGPQSPGTLGTLGLLFLLLVALVRAGAGPRVRGIWADGRVGALAAGTGAALLISASGGLATLFAFYVSPQLRASSRMAFFIGFFAICAVALVVDRWRPREGASRRHVGAFLAVCAGLLGFGWWDQTNPTYVPAYDAIKASWDNDAVYGRSVEQRLGGRGEVLQLPYHPFPEHPPVGRMADYDQFRSYLQTENIAWSYGAMKGRDEDWHGELSRVPVGRRIAAAAAAGIDGIEVDRFGVEDDGRTERILQRRLGPPAVVSADGRLAFYDARGYGRRLQARGVPAGVREAVFRPAHAEWGAGFSGPEPDGSLWAGPSSQVRIDNPVGRPRTVRLRTVLSTLTDATTTITGAGIRPLRMRTDEDGELLDLSLRVPPGGTTLRFATDGPRKEAPPSDTRVMHLYFVTPKVSDPALTSLRP